MNTVPTRVGSLGLAAAGVALFSVLIGLIRALEPVPNLSILYLLPVMYAAVTWGWWAALSAAVLAFLTYDFFFTEPVHTFTVRDPEEWLSLIIFLAVAAVTSTLAARERLRREEARRRANEAVMLYELGRTLSAGATPDALQEFGTQLQRDFGLAGCSVQVNDPGERSKSRVTVGVAIPEHEADHVLGRPTGSARHLGRWITIKGRTAERRPPVIAVPLHVGDRTIGSLRLVGRRIFSDEETRLLATIADQLAAALERERLRDEAQQAEILRQTDEIRQALLSSVSHDLRTPLASIKASADSMLQRDVQWSEQDRQSFLTTILRESDRLNRLVGNLLDMSRIQGGALRPQTDWYDLSELAREVIARLRPTLRPREIVLQASDELPPIQIDYLMIDQVLTNLIENAAKYSAVDSPITVLLEPKAEALRVCVIDHGAGIPPEERSRIFEKFYRLNPRGTMSGSGLGLAVCKGLVEAHAGRIWAEETPGGGATFCFDLPMASLPSEARSPTEVAV